MQVLCWSPHWYLPAFSSSSPGLNRASQHPLERLTILNLKARRSSNVGNQGRSECLFLDPQLYLLESHQCAQN